MTAKVANPGPVGRTPSSERWISTSTFDPHPWDMLSPLASEGFHTSQVNVAPRARMLAQPSMDGIGQERHQVGVAAGEVEGAQDLARPCWGGASMPRPAT